MNAFQKEFHFTEKKKKNIEQNKMKCAKVFNNSNKKTN